MEGCIVLDTVNSDEPNDLLDKHISDIGFIYRLVQCECGAVKIFGATCGWCGAKDTIEILEFEKLWSILNNPTFVPIKTLTQLIWWMRPRLTSSTLNILQVSVDIGACCTTSEAKRKIKEGAIRWNSIQVLNQSFCPTFIYPGWGILQYGKKTHFMAMVK